jgi:SPP1 family predicted phage head-tail adaptor
MARVPIGALRARLTIETPVERPDGAGGLTRSWSTLATAFAAIEPLSGEERLLADRLEERVTHRVSLRAGPALKAGLRFRRGARVLMIRSVYDPDERGTRLLCLCEEVKP